MNRLTQAQVLQVAGIIQKISPEEVEQKTDQELANIVEAHVGYTITSSNISSITKDMGLKTASRRQAKPSPIADLEVMLLQVGARVEDLEAKVAELEAKLEAQPDPGPESDELVPVSSLLN